MDSPPRGRVAEDNWKDSPVITGKGPSKNPWPKDRRHSKRFPRGSTVVGGPLPSHDGDASLSVPANAR